MSTVPEDKNCKPNTKVCIFTVRDDAVNGATHLADDYLYPLNYR